MRIRIDRILETPRIFRFQGTEEWLVAGVGQGILEGRLADPLALRVRAYRVGESLLLEGEVRGELPLACGRCLTRYGHPIHERFRLLLEPAGSRVPADPEGQGALARDGMCLCDDLESGWYQGSELQLSPLFHEVVALGLPVQPVCRPACRGLCPRCGVDRNLEACSCAERRPESPFAVLRSQWGRPPTRGESR